MALLSRILGDNLLRIRIDRRLTQGEIAEAIGISIRYYQSLEGGKQDPSFEKLSQIIINLELTPNELLIDPRKLPKEDLSKTYLIKAFEHLSEEMANLKLKFNELKSKKQKIKA